VASMKHRPINTADKYSYFRISLSFNKENVPENQGWYDPGVYKKARRLAGRGKLRKQSHDSV